jgi:protein O-GlcNAc transferase
MQNVFGFHDRSCFQVVGFTYKTNDGSAWRQNIEASCDEFYVLPLSASALEVANFINQQNIHILFNLYGWTSGGRQDVFVLKPAPISISYMGFCGSIGADFIDYIITDEIVSPP